MFHWLNIDKQDNHDYRHHSPLLLVSSSLNGKPFILLHSVGMAGAMTKCPGILLIPRGRGCCHMCLNFIDDCTEQLSGSGLGAQPCAGDVQPIQTGRLLQGSGGYMHLCLCEKVWSPFKWHVVGWPEGSVFLHLRSVVLWQGVVWKCRHTLLWDIIPNIDSYKILYVAT